MLKEKVGQYLQSLVSIVAANSRVAVLLLLLLDVLHTASTRSQRPEEEEEDEEEGEECVTKRGRQAENESVHSASMLPLFLELDEATFSNINKSVFSQYKKSFGLLTLGMVLIHLGIHCGGASSLPDSQL